jgi:hypothetical protein
MLGNTLGTQQSLMGHMGTHWKLNQNLMGHIGNFMGTQ